MLFNAGTASISPGNIEVEAGFMKMEVALADVQEVLRPGNDPKLPKNVSYQPGPRWDASYQEINVTHETPRDRTRLSQAHTRYQFFVLPCTFRTSSKYRCTYGW